MESKGNKGCWGRWCSRLLRKSKRLKAENEQMKTDLAIVHEYCNLDLPKNSRETLEDAIERICTRTAKYEDLKLTAGPLYEPEEEEMK